jgi:SagB-type dehydrogenase family enzyme
LSTDAFFRATELDRTTFAAWREGIAAADASGAALPGTPRSYPGYPTWKLAPVRPRWWPPLDRVLRRRRRVCPLGTRLPDRRCLSRLLALSHGSTGPMGAGPVPSAGGLQALELYLAILAPGWLPSGLYHYDRAGHHLAQIAESRREDLLPIVPSLDLFEGGSILWIVVGDGARAQAKYGLRGLRFLLLEAGHLMQDLCLSSVSVGLATVPLGGFFEHDLGRRLSLLATDCVLYTGVCGPTLSPSLVQRRN